ncbi:piercer of microtubule wall 2 protein [Chanodichthys erythropterus]|uniref:piercer of microtubule wall 2 protein n=1 Tax=Chanodichthys erythropterus TaxID=933992 RepID=UPI00351F3230
MDDHSADEGTRMEPEVLSSDTFEIKTSDVYKVDENLPTRFNNPECFRGYSQKMINPLYQTTNQTYGSKKPTVHEMPTTFKGSRRKFSEHLLKSGMYRENGFNTVLDKSRLTGPNTTTAFHDRINFHCLYHTDGKSQ